MNALFFLAFIEVIGSARNMKSGFISNSNDGWQIIVNTPHILSKDEARRFHFRFDTEKLGVYEEGNTEAFLTVHSRTLHQANYIGIAKGLSPSFDADRIAKWEYCTPTGMNIHCTP